MGDEFDKSKYVYELNITNFRNEKGNAKTKSKVKVVHPKLDDKKAGIILFYHHWCPHCQHMVPIWEKLGKKVKNNIFVGAVHGSNENSGNTMVFEQLSVQGVPDIRFVSNDNIVDNERYDGERTVDDLIKYINSKSKSVSKMKKTKKGGSKKKSKKRSIRKKVRRSTKKRNYRKNNKIKK